MRAREGEDITPAFSQLRSEQIDGVIVSQDGLFDATRKNIADLALAHQLPSIVYSRETLEAGALASYGPSSIALFRRAGAYINKILKGEKPADLPVELPTNFESIINLKTAKALDLKIPPTVVAITNEVIE
jgi:putative ABC transport system substrate-binding protein